MRSINRSAILEIVRQESPIARTQIARRLNMSLPTVMRIIDELIAEGLVRFSGNAERTGGRRRRLLEFNGNAYAVVGVDLGGTKMFGTVADLSGKIQHEIYCPHGHTPEESLEKLYDLIEQLLAAPRPERQQIRGIGVGASGVTLSPEGVVIWSPSLKWKNLALKKLLNERFEPPVFVENDVNLAALGEWGFGAGQGVQDLVCFYVGRGIGSGIIVGDALYRGHNQAAGEVGYLLPGIEFFGRQYDDFGALEYLASGTGILERARQLAKQAGAGTDQEITIESVFASAQQGEPWAQQLVQETAKYLGLAIVAVSAILNPEVIILKGAFPQLTQVLLAAIRDHIKGVVPFVPRLVASSLGHRATVMGAIMLVLNETAEYFVVKRLP